MLRENEPRSRWQKEKETGVAFFLSRPSPIIHLPPPPPRPAPPPHFLPPPLTTHAHTHTLTHGHTHTRSPLAGIRVPAAELRHLPLRHRGQQRQGAGLLPGRSPSCSSSPAAGKSRAGSVPPFRAVQPVELKRRGANTPPRR